MYPRARVELFGSGATGLALQDADIDLVVLGAGPTTTEGGGQGLTLVHFSAQLERFLWDRGCA
jgi:DNA polymerase sigma